MYELQQRFPEWDNIYNIKSYYLSQLWLVLFPVIMLFTLSSLSYLALKHE